MKKVKYSIADQKKKFEQATGMLVVPTEVEETTNSVFRRTDDQSIPFKLCKGILIDAQDEFPCNVMLSSDPKKETSLAVFKDKTAAGMPCFIPVEIAKVKDGIPTVILIARNEWRY